MKKGLNVWACPAEWTLEQIFSAAACAGFDGVEVALDETGELSLTSTKDELTNIRSLARANGIELYSVATGLYWQYSLTADCQRTRQKAKDIAKRQIDIAAHLGCETVLVVPGAVGVDFAPACGIIPYDTALARAREAVGTLAPVAEAAGVDIGLENVWNKFLLSALEIRDFIDNIGSPRVGAYFDVGNVVANGYPEHWPDILGSRIKKVHIKDFIRSVGTLDGFCPLLAGDVDFPAVMAALRHSGYDGWITAEVGVMAHYPMAGLEHTSNAMDYIIKGGK